jgi:hypothetical protein
MGLKTSKFLVKSKSKSKQNPNQNQNYDQKPRTKTESKSISKSQLGLGPGYKSRLSPETSLTPRQGSKMGLKNLQIPSKN